MCKFKEIGGKNTFSSTNYFFLLRLCFFLSRPLFSISTSLFIHAQFFSPSATFSKPAPYSQSANFYCIFWWTARWPLKKTTLWLCFSAVILICVSFPLDCHCVLPDYLPAMHLLTALLGELAILRHSRRSHMWKKKSQSNSMRSRKLIPLPGHCWMDWSFHANCPLQYS